MDNKLDAAIARINRLHRDLRDSNPENFSQGISIYTDLKTAIESAFSESEVERHSFTKRHLNIGVERATKKRLMTTVGYAGENNVEQ